MENFSNWFYLNEEFGLPFSVTKPIFNWLQDQRMMYLRDSKVKRSVLKVVLDFAGTSFEKLNSLPKVDRTVLLDTNYYSDKEKREVKNSPAVYYDRESSLVGISRIFFRIEDELYEDASKTISLVNHELMHQVQDLLAKYRNKDLSNLGFLSSRKLHKGLSRKLGVDVYGVSKKTGNEIEHGLISVEHNTNLTSLISDIEKGYYKLKAEGSDDPLMVMNDKEMKRVFVGENSDLKKYKMLEQGVLYNYYLKNIVKYFINKEYKQVDVDDLNELFKSNDGFVNLKKGKGVRRPRYSRNKNVLYDIAIRKLAKSGGKKELSGDELRDVFEYGFKETDLRSEGIKEVILEILNGLGIGVIKNIGKKDSIDFRGIKLPQSFVSFEKVMKNISSMTNHFQNAADENSMNHKFSMALYSLANVIGLAVLGKWDDDDREYFGVSKLRDIR